MVQVGFTGALVTVANSSIQLPDPPPGGISIAPPVVHKSAELQISVPPVRQVALAGLHMTAPVTPPLPGGLTP